MKWLAAVALVAPFLLNGCQDPCVALAERICGCELTEGERRTCRQLRISQQQSNVTIDEADRDFCEQKLETCNCTALDENRLEACGFAPADEGTE